MMSPKIIGDCCLMRRRPKPKKFSKVFLRNEIFLSRNVFFDALKVTRVSQRWADLVSVGFYSSNHYHCRSVTKTSVTLTNWPISPPRPSEAQPAIWVSCDCAISWYSVTKALFKCFLYIWIYACQFSKDMLVIKHIKIWIFNRSLRPLKAKCFAVNVLQVDVDYHNSRLSFTHQHAWLIPWY